MKRTRVAHTSYWPSIAKNGIVFTSLFFALAQRVSAQTAWSGVCVGGPDNDVATIQGLECLIANIFQVFITVIGLAGFVMMIVGAFRWLVSGGNSGSLDTAKKTMTFAVLGLVIALSAFIILNVIAAFTGINVITSFVIPQAN